MSRSIYLPTLLHNLCIQLYIMALCNRLLAISPDVRRLRHLNITVSTFLLVLYWLDMRFISRPGDE